MVKPHNPPGQQKNINSEECTTCTHARAVHQQKMYYCKAMVLVDDPNAPGPPPDHGPPEGLPPQAGKKIKVVCPCTQFTSNPILKVDKTDHGFANKPAKDKDKYVRKNIDIKPEDPKPSEPNVTISDPLDTPAQDQLRDSMTG